jgi:hypothetical protein
VDRGHGRTRTSGAKRRATRARTQEPYPRTVAAIEEAIRAGEDQEPLIVCSTGPEGRRVLLEGYKRATAYARVLKPDTEVRTLIGYSSAMESWLFF